MRTLEDQLRQDVQRLAGDIGERNVFRFEQLMQAAAFIEESFVPRDMNRSVRSVKRDRSRLQTSRSKSGAGVRRSRLLSSARTYDTARGTPGANDNGPALPPC